MSSIDLSTAKASRAIVLLCLISQASLAWALSEMPPDKTGDKAKEYARTGECARAAEILAGHLKGNPEDAEAHYLLGACLLQLGKESEADESFDRAVRIRPDYAFQVGREYKQGGLDALIDGDTGKARRLFGRAVHFQPDLRDWIADKCLDRARQALLRIDAARPERIDTDAVTALLDMAVGFQPALSKKACDLLVEIGNKADGEARLWYRHLASPYCNRNQ